MRTGTGTMTTTPRFLADAMLGKLARKMRMLGADVADAGGGGDPEIRYRCRAEKRVLLTRDTALARAMSEGAWLVHGSGFKEELSSIAPLLARAGFSPRPLTRCLEDNSTLEEIPRDQAAGLVPPHVLDTCESFWRCLLCGRVYWKGTHVANMEGGVGELLRILDRGGR